MRYKKAIDVLISMSNAELANIRNYLMASGTDTDVITTPQASIMADVARLNYEEVCELKHRLAVMA